MELAKQATWSAAPVERFLYRDTENRDADIVIGSAGGDVVAIETKAAASATRRDIRGLELLSAKLGARFKTGILVYSGEHTLALSDRVWALPLSGLSHAR